ncbi:MAG TPA: hypothetical protein VJL80_09675 [Aeromicrobium sp.]|nr:hypothetical protein [Aeromicrobium sp.]HKY58294.1 hypothetical protein [Aeromicrobium sp.]
MWWDQLGSWPSWVAMTIMMLIAFGGLAWLLALALVEEFHPRLRWADPRRRRHARSHHGETDSQ